MDFLFGYAMIMKMENHPSTLLCTLGSNKLYSQGKVHILHSQYNHVVLQCTHFTVHSTYTCT